MKDMEPHQAIANKFLDFVNSSPSAFHAVHQAKERLNKAGFQQLHEREQWNLQPNGKYYLTRNQSTIAAFILGGQWKEGNGAALIGAHTDSCNLQIKPNPSKSQEGYNQLNVACYGGGLWYTWFDRDLGLAGRVIVQEGEKYSSKLIHIDRPILRIPSLAVHLDRESGNKFEFNKEKQLVPILATHVASGLSGQEDMVSYLISKELGVERSNIHDYELNLFDTQRGVIGGVMSEFVFSARLDNLMMSFCALEALLEHSKNTAAIQEEKNVVGIMLFDHEEVGSDSAQGAGSPMMNELFRRLSSPELLQQSIRKSFLISADMAHAVHPNYSDKHENHHKPAINAGVVVKRNVNQRYATNAETGFILRKIASRHQLPLQEFVVKNDVLCGSTIGPILASKVGIRTVDVGNPQLSMHSIRETGGVADIAVAVELFTHYFAEFTAVDESITID